MSNRRGREGGFICRSTLVDEYKGRVTVYKIVVSNSVTPLTLGVKYEGANVFAPFYEVTKDETAQCAHAFIAHIKPGPNPDLFGFLTLNEETGLMQSQHVSRVKVYSGNEYEYKCLKVVLYCTETSRRGRHFRHRFPRRGQNSPWGIL